MLLKMRNLMLTLNSSLGGPQSQSGQFGEEENLLPLLRFETWIILRVA